VRLTPEQWAEARRLRDDLGLPYVEIAASTGAGVRTILRRAKEEGWGKGRRGPASRKNAATFQALGVVARRALVQRLYKAIDTKLKLMERRMQKQLANLDKEGGDLPSADHERDARAFGAMISNIEQVKEMQADLDRVAGGQPATSADAELFAEADRFRREIAERLARFIPASR
jgi:hypothetical protein